MKKNNKIILGVSIISVLTCGVIGLTPTKSMKNEQGIIVSKPTESNGILLNAAEIKMRNVGDTFILEAVVNEDATYKSVTFTSSDNEAISITKLSDTSCKLTKQKDFTEYVEITAKSDDPFIDLSSSCYIRAFNNLKSLNGDVLWSASKGDVNFELEDDYKFLLVNGASYDVDWEIQTIFGALDNNEYPDTYKNIEEEDLQLIKQDLQEIFGDNTLKNYSTFIDQGRNYIHFEFVYTNDIFNGLVNKELSFEYRDMDVSWLSERYIAATNVDIDNDEVLVI